jgi:hypothetical protein
VQHLTQDVAKAFRFEVNVRRHLLGDPI